MYSTSTTVTYIRKRWVVEPRSECVFEILQQPREGSTPDSVQTTDIGQTTYLCGTFLESFVHVLDHASGSIFNSINWVVKIRNYPPGECSSVRLFLSRSHSQLLEVAGCTRVGIVKQSRGIVPCQANIRTHRRGFM